MQEAPETTPVTLTPEEVAEAAFLAEAASVGATVEDGTASWPDKKGRRIAVKHLNALDYYRVARALGPAAAENETTLDLAVLASAVRKIDATQIVLPRNERDIEFLIQQLDFHGIDAAAKALKLLGNDDAKKELVDSKN